MCPVLMHGPQPNKTWARSELGEEEGTRYYCLALCTVTGMEMRTGESCRNRGDGGGSDEEANHLMVGQTEE